MEKASRGISAGLWYFMDAVWEICYIVESFFEGKGINVNMRCL